MSGFSYWSVSLCSDPLVAYFLLVLGSVFGAVVLHGGGITEVSDKKAVLVYLIIQVLGSNFILVSCGIGEKSATSGFLLSIAFVIKIGLYPFHWWIYYVFSCIRWKAFGPGLVLFKLGLVLGFPDLVEWWFFSIILGGSFLYSWMGVAMEGKMGSMKALISWLSVGDSSWAMLAKMLSLEAVAVYFFTSGISLLFVGWVMGKEGVSELPSLYRCKDPWSAFSGLCSYTGFPPFLGLVAKLYVVDEMLSAYPNELGAYLSLWGMMMSLVSMSVVASYLAAILMGSPKFKEPSRKSYLRLANLVAVSYSFYSF
uniref:NADH dehydrogenase subunit 2 n=1 Tax=Pinctada fucata TaxID=50426 RepID=G9MBK1_PINFU|nr:NADH dehydrogenase subunit 2 [Pinctada fucata]